MYALLSTEYQEVRWGMFPLKEEVMAGEGEKWGQIELCLWEGP